MPDTGLGGACEVAERVRAAVASLGQPHQAVTQGVVTASIGVAVATPSLDTSPDQLVEQADVELYRAKRAGRNRVKGAGAPQ
jgi:diguanylate cyclase (GGDEF)-like protein